MNKKINCLLLSTQIGEDSIRTCDTVSINDCQTANGVRYCYCNKDLCNGITVSINI